MWNALHGTKSSEQSVRRMRQRIFDYPPEKEEQAARVLVYLKRRVARQKEQIPQTRGQYSGLTRSELHRSGTCETDWF